MKSAKEIDDIIASALQSNNIACIKAILYPTIADGNSVGVNDIEEFLAFLQAENIKSVFRSCLDITADDYYITDETLVEHMGHYRAAILSNIVRKKITAYNHQIDKYDFGSLRQVLYFVIFNGFMVYYIFEDSVPFDDPSDVLEDIIAANEGELAREQEQQKTIINSLKEKLKQKILADPAFALQTNQKLRRSYAIDLWYNLSEEYEPLKQYWSAGGHMKSLVVEFVDLTWAEYKQSKKK